MAKHKKWIKRKDGHRQRYWVGRKQKKSYNLFPFKSKRLSKKEKKQLKELDEFYGPDFTKQSARTTKVLKNYGFLFKSINWQDLRKEARERKDDPRIVRGRLHTSDPLQLVQIDGTLPSDVMKHVDWDKGFTEMRSKGAYLSPERESELKKLMRQGRHLEAYEKLPRYARMSLNLARNVENISQIKSEKPPTVLQPIRVLVKRKTVPRERTRLLQEGDKYMAQGDVVKAKQFYTRANKLR